MTRNALGEHEHKGISLVEIIEKFGSNRMAVEWDDPSDMNMAKWEAARAYAGKRGMWFSIWTEKTVAELKRNGYRIRY